MPMGRPPIGWSAFLQTVAASLGVQASFLSTPTSVFATFEGDKSDDAVVTRLLRLDAGELNLGKLVEFDEIMKSVEHGRVTPRAAMPLLDSIAVAPSRYGNGLATLAFAVAAAGAAGLLGGGVVDIACSAVIGVALAFVGRGFPRRPDAVGALEPLSAFVAAMLAALAATLAPTVDVSVVTISSLIILVPGLALTMGLAELASRHLVSGMARLAGAAAVFFTMLFGVALGWRVGGGLAEAIGVAAVEVADRGVSPLLQWGIIGVSPIAFAVLFEARTREFLPIWLTSVAAFAAATAGAVILGPDLGPFLGALTAGVGGNLYGRLVDRPGLVPMTPAILLLVPGSLGFRSLTSFLHKDAVLGVDWAFQTGMVAASLVGGLLIANVVLPPRRVL